MELLAKSLAGHDAKTVYYVVRQEGDFFYLSDGRLKTVEHPKKKNKKHLQIIRNIPRVVADILKEDVSDDNAKIRKALKAYQSERLMEDL